MTDAPKDLKPIGVKAPMSLLARAPLGAIAGVFEHGAIKYGPWNWQDKSQPQARIEELHNALLRHVLASGDPSEEDFDDESGIHHLAHAGACIMILLFKLGIDYQPSNWVNNKKDTGPVGVHGLDPGTIIERNPVMRRACRAFWTELLLQEVPENYILYRCIVTQNLSLQDPAAPELRHYVTEGRLRDEGLLPGLPYSLEDRCNHDAREEDTTKNGCYERPELIQLGGCVPGGCGGSETVCHDIGPAFDKVRQGMARDLGMADKWDFQQYGPEMAMPFLGNMIHISDEHTKRKIVDYFDKVPELLGKIPLVDSYFVQSHDSYWVTFGRMLWRVKLEEIAP